MAKLRIQRRGGAEAASSDMPLRVHRPVSINCSLVNIKKRVLLPAIFMWIFVMSRISVCAAAVETKERYKNAGFISGESTN
jgi:hypothetical protein